MKRPRVMWGLIGVVLTLTILNAAAVRAVQDLALTPTRVQLELNAGGSTGGAVGIINQGDTAYDFRVYPSPYNVTGEDYSQSFSLKPQQVDVSHWISVTTSPYHLTPGQRQDVPYKVTVPQGTVSGGYYAVLFAETVAPPVVPGQTGVILKKRVGAIFYIRVPGAVDEQGSIDSFTAHFWQSAPPLRTDLRMANRGNVHYAVSMEMVVTDLLGKKKADISSSNIVLPQTVRHFVLAWTAAPHYGIFKVSGTVQYLDRSEALPSHLVLMAPAGILVATLVGVVVLIFLAVILWRRSRRRHRV